jgi:ABC-2 type transport system ATP-binding protein
VSASSSFAVETRDLRKVFGSHVAVKGLSLTVGRGEIFGFLGPNGAGKSTSIKMLLGLIAPSSGFAEVLGAPSGTVDIRRRIGFLPEDFRFYEWLTAAELLALHGRLAGMDASHLRARVPAVLEMVGIAQHAARRLRGFSKGMLQRLGLGQALIHDPDIIFLDEPTSGLDPMGRRMVRDVIRAQRDRGTTVFLNSHLLSEIELTCDRVAFIKDGQVVATHDLRTVAPEALHVTARVTGLPSSALAGLSALVTDPRYDDDQLSFGVASHDALPEVVRLLVASGANLYSIAPERQSLEDMFVRLVGEDRGL